MRSNPDAVDPGAAIGDFYDLAGMVPEEDRALLKGVREFLAEHVTPRVDDHWAHATYDLDFVPAIRELGITGMQYDGHGCPSHSSLTSGLVTMELSRVDPSFATLLGVHGGLAVGSIMLCGSEEQKAAWIPPMLRWDTIGAFGLTEPDVGSGVSRGLMTTARRDGDDWVIDGAKKWIGNATFADVIVIWGRDTGDDQVKGFLVEKGSQGLTTEKIEGKVALRSVQNALITLDGVRVPESHRLQNASSFRDTARVLRLTRAGVAWSSVGCAVGAYEAAREYAMEREQFGRPIAGFQLVQDLLSKMLANITASQALGARLAALQDDGSITDQQASLAKMYCTTRTRETVSWAREVMGGNGILLENKVARFLVDSEALYSYEGTREVNSLIVARSITGISAFV